MLHNTKASFTWPRHTFGRWPHFSKLISCDMCVSWPMWFFCLCVWEQNQLVFFSQMHLWIAVVFERVCVCACAQAYVASFSATALNFANASVFWHDYLKVTLCVRKLLPFQTIMSKRFAHLRQDEDCTHVCVSVSVWCVSVCVRLHPDSMSL